MLNEDRQLLDQIAGEDVKALGILISCALAELGKLL